MSLKGDKLVVSSASGSYIFIYSTLNTKNNFLPVQKFCYDQIPGKMHSSLDIIDINFENILNPSYKHNMFKIEVSLIIVTAPNGCIYLFQILNDNELLEQVVKNSKEMNTGEWLWSKLAPALPNNIANLVMNGPTVKIDLKAI